MRFYGCAWVAAAYLWLAAPGLAAADDFVTLFIGAFQGDRRLGVASATVLNLQIWQELRVAGTQSRGTVVWHDEPLAEFGHDYAAAFARRGGQYQAVLWGSVNRFGADAVVQPYLTIPRYPKLTQSDLYSDFRREHPEEWSLQIPASEGRAVLSVDLPSRQVRFEPIVLEGKVLDQYDTPATLKVYRTPELTDQAGTLGSNYTALEVRGDLVKVRIKGQTRWARLPLLAETRSEVADYANGVVAAMRGDWSGTERFMRKVTERPDVPQRVRVDAFAYQLMALARMNKSTRHAARHLREESPFNANVRKYLVMAAIQELVRDPLPQGAKAIAERALDDVFSGQAVAGPADPWFARAELAIDLLAGRGTEASPPRASPHPDAPR